MNLILKKTIFIVKPMVDFLRMKMDARVYYILGLAKSVDIPDQYVGGDNIQILATYLYNCDALSDKDAVTIVENSRFSSIEELVDYWRPKVDNLIDAEMTE